MSTVQATNRVKIVEPLVIENATIDDDAVSDLVERHLKDFQSLQSTEASPLFGRPIVLKNCAISPEHLELLQTLPKLRMLRLEDCIISGGTKISETYAHIGKQKDSAPIMSKVENELAVLTEKECDAQNAAVAESGAPKHRFIHRIAPTMLKPEIRCISYTALQKFVWQCLKTNGKFKDIQKLEDKIDEANNILKIVITYLLQKFSIGLSELTVIALTDENIQNLRTVINNQSEKRTAKLDGVQIEKFRSDEIPCSLLQLRGIYKCLVDPEQVKYNRKELINTIREHL